MTLNPIQFGSQVVDQFGRYLITAFPIADPELNKQFKRIVAHPTSGLGYFAKGPYIHLNQPFQEGKNLDEIIRELKMHPGVKAGFPWERPHKHQEDAIRSILYGYNTIITTGTGSGKTESFLLPIMDYCLKKRDENKKYPGGVLAVIVYPMNALVNDQMKRLRTILAGTEITYAKYTGETPDKDPGMKRFNQTQKYNDSDHQKLSEDPDSVPYPWEMCTSVEEIRTRKPMILLTNYKQLEYLLLRNRDIDLFRGAGIKYLVFDEVHTYTGILGSEVAFLIRRLKATIGHKENIILIGTSATVSSKDFYGIDPTDATLKFGHRLFGVDKDKIKIISESYEIARRPPDDAYMPPLPSNVKQLLEDILARSKEVQNKDEVKDIPNDLLKKAEELCGRKAPSTGTNLERLSELLLKNKMIYLLNREFAKPRILCDIFDLLKNKIERKLSDEELGAEILAYLTLGAIAKDYGEPLLRPKIHYFISGLHGLIAGYDKGKWRLFKDDVEAESFTDSIKLPIHLCRTCGQHYFKVNTDRFWNGAQKEGEPDHKTVTPAQEAPEAEQISEYLTDKIIGEDETSEKGTTVYMCPKCGTLHTTRSTICHNASCSRTIDMIEMTSFSEDELKTCPSCNAINKDNSTIRATTSGTVSDATILAQTMLSAMPEEEFQKILIFTDNRQEAAFQAAWMEERSKRFRLRHLLYRELDKPSKGITQHNFNSLTEDLKELAYDEGIYWRQKFGRTDQDIANRIRWFLLEEFCTNIHRKSSTENLGLSQIIYEGLDDEDLQILYKKWGEIFGVQPDGIKDTTRLILDYIRRKNVISDNLMRTQWFYTDREVREGIVSAENIYPRVISYEKISDPQLSKYYSITYVASNLRSGAQVIVKKAIKKEPDLINNFLEELWKTLKNKKIFVEGHVYKYYNNKKRDVDLPGDVVQINIEKLGIIKPQTRYKCTTCGKSHSKLLPTRLCPEYRCSGKTIESGIEKDNYDVVQYTQMSFVPLKSSEHSAQVSKEDRQEIEREFKKINGRYNCLVCTPTLELGVDLGKLEMVLLRNAPPAPSNYAQRAGRAGRRHRIAVIFTYCQKTAHDRYFFDKPNKMIGGEIRLPAFSMNNDLLVRKHAHSVILSTLRQKTNPTEAELLDEIFPTFISNYIAYKDENDRTVYHDTPFDIQSKLAQLTTKYQADIKTALTATFKEQWPKETYSDTEWFTEERIDSYITEMPTKLQGHINRLFKIINTYKKEISKYAKIETAGRALKDEEDYERKKVKNALSSYMEPNQKNYSLSYLADDGFFPGYSLSRESCWAHCLDPYQEILRPAPTALYEFAPGNYVYANKNKFRIHKLDFYKSKREDAKEDGYILGERLLYLREKEMVYSPGDQITEGGEIKPIEVVSYEMADVELSHESRIDDTRDYRINKRYQIILHPKTKHNGGFSGKANEKTIEFFKRRDIQLINLGLKTRKDKIGFPICPRCGEIRSPDSTEPELQRFFEVHKKRCKIDNIKWNTIHVQMDADILFVGPYETESMAINAVEGIRLGAENVLDMGEVELGVYVAKDISGIFYATLVDPMPGGSGFLNKIIDEWQSIIRAGINKLENCRCEKACYTCMKHYRNQIHHKILDRQEAKDLLYELDTVFKKETDIEANIEKSHDISTADSKAEEDLIKILNNHSFPTPDDDHKKITLSNGDSRNVDYIYNLPNDKRVLIFVDGTSKELHGDQTTATSDKIWRTKAKHEGYLVLTITKQGLQDTTNINAFLQELAIYISREDLLKNNSSS